MMRFHELTEAFTGDLYHGTSIENAESILQDNQISVDYSEWESQVSLTRQFEVAQQFAFHDGYSVIFVIDRAKLKAQVGDQMAPIDYNDWHPDYDPATHDHSSDHDDHDDGGESGEYEEMVFVDINNIDKICKGIYLVHESDVVDDKDVDLSDYPHVANFPKLKEVPARR